MRTRTMRELSAQAHELSISHHAQAHQLLITALTTTYVNDDILRASAQGIYITLRDGNDNNNGDGWWQQMSTTRPHGWEHGIYISRRVVETTTAKIGGDEWQLSDDEALCLSTQHIHIASRDVNNDNGKQFDDSIRGLAPRPFLYRMDINGNESIWAVSGLIP